MIAIWLAALVQDPIHTRSHDLPADLEQIHATVIETAAPAVVGLRVDREPEARKAPSPAGVFGERPAGATCSGLIVDPAGYIVTSWFNVEGKLRKIVAILHDGSEHEAKLLGYDAPLDIALLKIQAQKLPTLQYVRAADLEQGEPVYALGRAPGGRALSFNPGVLSARERFAGKMVQTDARTNFGNVGGPLVDRRGRVIGVTCKISTRTAMTYGQNSGVSFAAAWEKIAEAMPSLKQGARQATERRPFLGITYDSESTDKGVRILDVHPGTAAEKGGVKPGDRILEFGGQAVETPTELLRQIHKLKIGDEVKLKIRRGSETLDLVVKLGEREVDE
jgi:S1-C subfamily serine protease